LISSRVGSGTCSSPAANSANTLIPKRGQNLPEI
jgi:hypothetical protein